MSQNPDGSWDATPGLALAILAQKVRAEGAKHLTKADEAAWRTLLVAVTTEGEQEAEVGVLSSGASNSEGALCPLTGLDSAAIEWSIPPSLAEACAAAAAAAVARDEVLCARKVWATLLTVAALRRLDESFLLKTEDRDGFEETVVVRLAAPHRCCDRAHDGCLPALSY